MPLDSTSKMYSRPLLVKGLDQHIWLELVITQQKQAALMKRFIACSATVTIAGVSTLSVKIDTVDFLTLLRGLEISIQYLGPKPQKRSTFWTLSLSVINPSRSSGCYLGYS